jgi:hypothetical protein
VYCSLPVHTDK